MTPSCKSCDFFLPVNQAGLCDKCARETPVAVEVPRQHVSPAEVVVAHGCEKQDLVAVRRLGEAIGYGNLMVTAERAWRESLGEHSGGEFAVYCCAFSLVECVCLDNKHGCEWCCGAGRVTKAVHALILKQEQFIAIAKSLITYTEVKYPSTDTKDRWVKIERKSDE
jgi:hypothetical protein